MALMSLPQHVQGNQLRNIRLIIDHQNLAHSPAGLRGAGPLSQTFLGDDCVTQADR
jgi:hypothetical protein